MFNSGYFTEQIMMPLVDKICTGGRNLHAPGIQVHRDNCRLHSSKMTQGFLDTSNLGRVVQPPYTKNLAPSHFWLFGYLKSSLAGCNVHEPDELLEIINAILKEVPKEKLDYVLME
jgi:hypothetical protein